MTREQLSASDPTQSVWVSASAGTGKTRVLVNRILRLLLDGTAPERILCITYTKAAAAEVVHRIQEIVTDWAVVDGRTLIGYLNEVLNHVPNANEKAIARRLLPVILQAPGGMRVMTIHAFCQSVLSRFPLEAEINPGSHIMDEMESLSVLYDARQEMLDNLNVKPSPVVRSALDFLYDHVSEDNQNALTQNVLQKRYRLSRFFKSFNNDLKKIRTHLYGRFGLDPKQTLQKAQDNFIKAVPKKAWLSVLAEMQMGSKTTVERAQVLQDWLHAEPKQLNDYLKIFLTGEGKIRSNLLPGIKNPSPQLQQTIDAEVARIEEYSRLQSALVLAESSFSLTAIAFDILLHYNRLKAENSLLDYEDQIILTARLLTELSNSQWVLYKLDGGIDHILVDEAQDTSPAQWDIIGTLAEEFFSGKGYKNVDDRTIFIVGDEKQSIFSFQNADPAEFARMRAFLAEHAQSGQANWGDVALIENFRSSQLILDFTDTVFNQNNLNGYLSEREQNIRHIASHKEKAGRIELWPLVPVPESENPSYMQQPEFVLAQNIADEVQRLLQSKTVLSTGKIIQPGDIMILVRKRNPMVTPITKALKDRNIAVSGADRMILKDQLAAQDYLAAIQVGLNPHDDYNMACFLKSPFIGMSEEDLFALCHDRPSTIWHRMQHDGHKNIVDFCTMLTKWVGLNTPVEFLQRLSNHPCLSGATSGRYAMIQRLGFEADDIFNELLDAARSFETLHPPDNRSFMNWVLHSEAAVKKQSAERDAGRVRIMTVHASKGLQAPIVILADPTTKPESYQSNRDVMWEPDFDQGFLWSAGAGRNHPVFQDAHEAFIDALFGEYYRLLYVAITRAEERLIVAGWQQKRESHRNYASWYQVVQNAATAMQSHKEYQAQKDNNHITLSFQAPPEAQENDEVTAILKSVPSELRQHPPDEARATRPLRPSQPTDQAQPTISPLTEKQNNNFRRGQVIHRILSVLPEYDQTKQSRVLERLLDRDTTLNTDEKTQISDEIMTILNDARFGHLFTTQARAEVSIVGEVDIDGAPFAVSGQIDRIIVTDDKVTILDFKTNRPAAATANDVPEIYRKQMRAYKLLIEKIYPEKVVETVLLWTSIPSLMPISV